MPAAHAAPPRQAVRACLNNADALGMGADRSRGRPFLHFITTIDRHSEPARCKMFGGLLPPP
jgi:hypothetical protein